MHLLAINASPGVPEPPLEVPEPPLEVPELPLEVPEPEPDVDELEGGIVVEVVAGGGAWVTGGGAGPTGVGAGPDHDGCFHGNGNGTATVSRAKKPMITREVMPDPKERMADGSVGGWVAVMIVGRYAPVITKQMMNAQRCVREKSVGSASADERRVWTLNVRDVKEQRVPEVFAYPALRKGEALDSYSNIVKFRPLAAAAHIIPTPCDSLVSVTATNLKSSRDLLVDGECILAICGGRNSTHTPNALRTFKVLHNPCHIEQVSTLGH